MLKFKQLLNLVVIFLVCCQNAEDEEYKQIKFNAIEAYNVKNHIEDIHTEKYLRDPFISIIDSFLVILDFDSEKGLRFYGKTSFEYITNTGLGGRGPGEIYNIENIAFNLSTREIWVGD